MADRGVAFDNETAERIVRNTRNGEATPLDVRGNDLPDAGLSRFYREFELTAELSGGEGATAAVNWLVWNDADQEMVASGETGTVLDHLGNAWGIEGERGEARFLGGNWVISRNPGRAIYQGKLDGDLDSGSYATMSVWEGDPLADSSVDITVHDGSTLAFITSSKKIASTTPIMAAYDPSSGKFYRNIPGDCEEDQ